jgi:hypothetical protein
LKIGVQVGKKTKYIKQNISFHPCLLTYLCRKGGIIVDSRHVTFAGSLVTIFFRISDGTMVYFVEEGGLY